MYLLKNYGKEAGKQDGLRACAERAEFASKTLFRVMRVDRILICEQRHDPRASHEQIETLPGRMKMIVRKSVLLWAALASLLPLTISGQTPARLKLAAIDFGDSQVGRAAADTVVATLKRNELNIVDRDGSRLAARGAGYRGSLNLSLKEARSLGEAIGCDFYLIGDAQTLRRSRSNDPIYFESYASVFLVSSRTGKLITWERLSFESASPAAAEEKLLLELGRDDLGRRYRDAIQGAHLEEKRQRESARDITAPVIEEAPEDDEAAAASGLRLPRPYRRLRPVYPESAASADAEAVVDVLVELDEKGEVNRVDLARWAGFGLDEASLNTARQLHFFPALRDGNPIPMRILLRYNFRKSAK